jgi:hypothetical protein
MERKNMDLFRERPARRVAASPVEVGRQQVV